MTDLSLAAALDALRAALTQLRALAALPSANPSYAQAAEQVAAIIAGLETGPGQTPKATSILPDPPNPGLTSQTTDTTRRATNQPEPTDPD